MSDSVNESFKTEVFVEQPLASPRSAKHVNTKHSQLHKCYTCREMFKIKDSLEVHKENVHGEEETVRVKSFVFSESMFM